VRVVLLRCESAHTTLKLINGGLTSAGTLRRPTRPAHRPPILNLNTSESHIPPSSSSLSIPTNSTHRNSSSSEATPNSRTSIIGKGRRVLSKRRRGFRSGGAEDPATVLRTRRLKDRFGVGTQMDYEIGESDSSENRGGSSEQHRLSGPSDVQASSRASNTAYRTPPSSPDYRSSVNGGETVESPRKSIDVVAIFDRTSSDEGRPDATRSTPRRRDSTLRPSPPTVHQSVPLLTLTPNSPTSPLTSPRATIYSPPRAHYSSADLYSGSSGSESDHLPSESPRPSDPHRIFPPSPPHINHTLPHLPTDHLSPPPRPSPPRSLSPLHPPQLPPKSSNPSPYGLMIPHLGGIDSVGSLRSSLQDSRREKLIVSTRLSLSSFQR
jgi:hypothetical protein